MRAKQAGATLLEVILYISFIALFIPYVVIVFSWVVKVNLQSRLVREINLDSLRALQHMSVTIRNGIAINTPSIGLSGGTLTIKDSNSGGGVNLAAGPRDGGTFVNDIDAVDTDWVDPENAVTSDNLYATVILNGLSNPPPVGLDDWQWKFLIKKALAAICCSSSSSRILKITNFGFTIPPTAAINGIIVEIERSADGTGDIRDNIVRVIKTTVNDGANEANTALTWPTVDDYAAYGSATHLWGQTWTPAEINSVNFGVAIKAANQGLDSDTAKIDHARVTVYYTTAGVADTTTYNLQTNQIMVQNDDGPWAALTSGNLVVSNLTFSNTSKFNTPGTVTISFKINNNFGSEKVEKNFYVSESLRDK